MAVIIKIKGNTETNEHKDAIALKEIFENEFREKSVNGEILIICNATLFGQETKDVDLIAIGKFEEYSVSVNTKAKAIIKGDKTELEQKKRQVFIKDFCFVIETKKHRAEDVLLDGITLKVRYDRKLSDVTTQSENQKYSLMNYFYDRLNMSPYICNFIWLRNVGWGSIQNLLGDNPKLYDKHNYLPNTFTLRFLFQLACVQVMPFNSKNWNGTLKDYCTYSSLQNKIEYNLNEINSIFDLFQKVKEGAGELTRNKIEKITSKLLQNQQYAQSIGEKMIIISGRAGTGKTIKLLNIACDLAEQQGARSMILTYNHALVSDIKRTLALAEIPDGIDSYAVNISTLDKFFFEILIGLGIGSIITKNGNSYIPDYINRKEKLLLEMKEYIDANVIGKEEIADLMKSRNQQVGWDYVLIDEAQDWDELEKEIILLIFGKEKIIIADGVDQLIRSQSKCNWTRALKPEYDFKKTNEKKGLRQKVNLVAFVNAFAEKINVKWQMQAKEELIGGKIIVSTIEYSKQLHNKEFDLCKANGNSAYEMMFLVPPSLVNRSKEINLYKEQIVQRSFSKLEEFKQMGISVWDGTSTNLRTQYVVDLNQHKLLQYESCRGLEGWTVVCLELDEFIRYKMETFKEEETGELALESYEEKRSRFVYLWALIPLTRAIDTLIITIKNKESKIAKMLRQVYEENPDFIEWIE